MIKKYEIITVEGKKRIKALRSFRVQDRFVNIGDVGGIVYDENTLSQEGNAWIFSGNFYFPGARIGGDSIVDIGETTLSAAGAPNVDILGSSVVVGSKLRFETDQTAADSVVLTADDFEQGLLTFNQGSNWETWKSSSPGYLRTKAPIFMGGASKTLKLEVPGYQVQAYVLDRDGIGVAVTAPINTGEDVTLAIPAGQYFMLRLSKNPSGAIVPADATAAQITFTGTYETKLSIVDSRLEINPATSRGVLALRTGGTYTMAPGVKYPDSVIQNSKVSVMMSATDDRLITLMAEFINTSAVIDTSAEVTHTSIGIYKNVKNLTFSGRVTGDAGVSSRGVIQATNCNDFGVSATIFPGLAAAQTANMPFIFTRCNVPNGRFYHHAEVKNIYTDIDFSKASADLGKALTFGTLCSSEVEGMYRLYSVTNKALGALVESYDSVKDADFSDLATTAATTIYEDAKLTGLFNISGTNVFGGTGNHGGGKGCEITNTKETAMDISGNVRVEGNAKVKDTSISGTGYFGGNSITENANVVGCIYVADNGVYAPAPETGKVDCIIRIVDNAKFLATSRGGTTWVHMSGNSEFSGKIAFSTTTLEMHGRSKIAGIVSAVGTLIMEDNADTSDKGIWVRGRIRLVGDYRQTTEKSWTGNRTISSENEPTYDNNVKTKYDF